MTTITALPTPPSTGSPSTFDALADAFIDALPTMVTQINENLLIVATSTDTCTASAIDASAAAGAAINITTAPKWVSGTFAVGDVRWSPINGLSYRCKVAGSRTLDPSTDPTNWFTIGATADTLNASLLLERTNAATLTTKTIALGSNTISGTLAQFNAAVSDADLVSLVGTESLTNKTLVSPILSGVPTAPTAAVGTNTTQVATTAFVQAAGRAFSAF